jgi:tRNA pseudouridine38-40 synthase
MNNYKIIVQYEGTKYNGWQKQGNTDNTIQGKIETVLSKMVGSEVEIAGSGRTDAGAHAYGQVANFHIDTDKTPAEILEYMNQYLPQDIAVIAIEIVPERFHSRLNAKSKRYVYRIWNSAIPDVFDRRFMHTYTNTLDIEAMRKATQYLIGEHDFKSFCSNKKFKKSTVRTIYSIEIIKENNEIRFTFVGNGFLYNMVRILIGTLVEVGEGKKQPEQLLNIIAACDRETAGITMPAEGLTLMDVQY